MAATVYTSGTAPWLQPGRTVETYRGGLLKLTDSYITPTSELLTSLGTLEEGDVIADVYQSFDSATARIYPAPQWRDHGDGFSTISVTAYGRTTTNAYSEEGMQQAEVVTTTTTDGTVTSVETTSILSSVFTLKYTRLSVESRYLPDITGLDPVTFASDGTEFTAYDTYTRVITINSSNYYGYVTEVTMTVTFQFTKAVTVTTPP